MPKPVKLIIDRGASEGHEVSFELSDDDLRMIADFRDQSRLVLQTTWVRETLARGISMKGTPGGVKVTLPSVDRQQQAALLHLYRPILLDREPFSFKRVVSMLGRHGRGTHFAAMLKGWRKRFDGQHDVVSYTLEVGGVRVDDSAALSRWLNAYEYHRDPEKRATLDAMVANVPDGWFEAANMTAIAAQLDAVGRLAELCDYLLVGGSGDQFKTQ